ncbi:tripartite tricarboxylate transporter substrate-binding protein [Variovorax sp. HW608]|uniref:tripartite tricarboxylate transporter substrate-binding protein n=1 Tax=Variovorax sp. HW608 TaxID=1034889 RepID=UPI000B5AEBF4|nr:tripartite tricarboxylate transporter substrate-binding protein [Variovorax sp. HW608]
MGGAPGTLSERAIRIVVTLPAGTSADVMARFVAPTIAELELGSPLYSWNGLFAPASTPQPIVDQLSRVLQDIALSNEYRQKVIDFTQVPRGGTAAEFAVFLRHDSEAWGRAIANSNVRLD